MTNSAEADQAAEQAAQSESFREWYRNDIWGKQARDDDALFEVMSLQVFQAGLTWNMILARRDAFREAFHGWRVDAVANMGPQEVDRLVQDPSIIRNRRKSRLASPTPAPSSPCKMSTAPSATGSTACSKAPS